MKLLLSLILFTHFVQADDSAHQKAVLQSIAGNWSGWGKNVNINSQNKEFPSSGEQKMQGKLIFQDKALFRRTSYKVKIPDREDRLYNSFVISFWLDFKQRYRSITFDSRGVVFYKDFTQDKEGKCNIYSKVDGKYIYTGSSKISADKFSGSSEYESKGYVRKSSWEFSRIEKLEFKDPKVDVDPSVKKVLDGFPGKYPLKGHFKLHEGKEVLTVYGYLSKEKTFMKWEIHIDGNYKVFAGKEFLESDQGYWKQIE